jgi:8-oxo-dGTP pyrophosphatase MutT (NUDIX family)
MDRLTTCDQFDRERYLEFQIERELIGYISHEFADVLAEFSDVFQIEERGISLHPALLGFDQRTQAIARVLEILRVRGLISRWYDEPYIVSRSFSSPPLMNIERGAIPLFGSYGYGVHINGFVREGEKLKMWLGRRAYNRAAEPGKLDQIVAGGQPAGLSLEENLIKECAEEAGMPPKLARKASPVGAISYITEREEGLRRDVLFNYDLELPLDFKPVNTDGEVGEFLLWPIEDVAACVESSDEFKFNCSHVVIDFLIRHGYMKPDHPEYLDLLKGLHSA